jgi:hypothetical protein
MFFADLSGNARDAPVAEAIAGLRELCEEVRVLGSYPAARESGAPQPTAGAHRDGPRRTAPR